MGNERFKDDKSKSQSPSLIIQTENFIFMSESSSFFSGTTLLPIYLSFIFLPPPLQRNTREIHKAVDSISKYVFFEMLLVRQKETYI